MLKNVEIKGTVKNPDSVEEIQKIIESSKIKYQFYSFRV
jgi:hypothetical protein